jgi:hypothetical protein
LGIELKFNCSVNYNVTVYVWLFSLIEMKLDCPFDVPFLVCQQQES